MRFCGLLIAAALALCLFTLSGCDLIQKATEGIQGNIAGDIVDKTGNTEAYRTVVLVKAAEKGTALQTETTDENGHFFFQKVDGGDYNVIVQGPNGEEYDQIDEKPIQMSAGRTLNIVIKIDHAKTHKPTIVFLNE